jgi:hypothetical protein
MGTGSKCIGENKLIPGGTKGGYGWVEEYLHDK